jgi:hypothetical protein
MKKIFSIGLGLAATFAVAGNVWAQSKYVSPAGALGCADCHVGGNTSKVFVTGILEAFPIDQKLSIPDKIKAIHALTDEQRLPALTAIKALLNPAATEPDTAPVVSPLNSRWNVTIGEEPLTIPVSVADAEDDAFTIGGNGLFKTPVTVDAASGLAKFNMLWTASENQAGQLYPVSVFVKESDRGHGRILASNVVKTSVKIWPARANAATAQVKYFDVQVAKWKKGTLNLEGVVTFKSNVTAEQQTAALSALTMSLTTAKSKTAIGSPLSLTIDANGKWKQSIALTATEVPCTVVADYEGLKAERPVSSAPRATCLK